MATDFERRFLMRLATAWLACRAQVMGHVSTPWAKGPAQGCRGLEFALRGLVDYEQEMWLECGERKREAVGN